MENETQRKIRDSVFGAVTEVVDNGDYENCLFEGTQLLYRGHGPIRFNDCQFNGIALQFDEGAATALQMFTSFYQMARAAGEGPQFLAAYGFGPAAGAPTASPTR